MSDKYLMVREKVAEKIKARSGLLVNRVLAKLIAEDLDTANLLRQPSEKPKSRRRKGG